MESSIKQIIDVVAYVLKKHRRFNLLPLIFPFPVYFIEERISRMAQKQRLFEFQSLKILFSSGLDDWSPDAEGIHVLILTFDGHVL